MKSCKNSKIQLNEEKSISRIEMVDKTLSVLDYIFRYKKVTFTDIKDDMGIPKATLHRILFTLESKNYIDKNKLSNEYSLGIIFVYYGEELKSRLTLINICEGYLAALASEVGESVNLNILYKESVLNILTLEGEESVLTSKLMPISPLNCSASGKLFLAQKNNSELKKYFVGVNWEKRTINSITTYEDFLKEKETILSSGVSYDNEEYEYGLYCIAKPLKNHNGIMKAVVSITGPITRMKMKNIETLVKMLSYKTDSINEKLIKTKFTHNTVY